VPAPTFVSATLSAWNASTTPKTASITTQAGDRLVVGVGCENNAGTGYTTPTGNSVTFGAFTVAGGTGNFGEVGISTATDSVGGTAWTLSVGRGGATGEWGFVCYVFRGSDGFGTPAAGTGSGGPSLALTTTQDNSAIVYVSTDWNAVDGASRTWRAINVTPTSGNGMERQYYRNAAAYSAYSAYWSDTATAGAKTTGLSAPTGQAWAVAAVEVKGTAGAAAGSLVVPRKPGRGLLMRGRR
jgi:hypothetical protein